MHQKTDPQQARKIVSARLGKREQSFLEIIQRQIFGYAQSPYLKLMRHAGLEQGDIQRLLRQDGLEGCLHSLLKAGVYLSVDEFKGRKPAARGSASIETGPLNLRNPGSEFHIPVHSGGSRTGSGTPVMIDLAYVRDCAVDMCLHFHLHGGDDWLKSDWEVPGGGALFRLLKCSQFGKRPVKWFSQLDPASPGLHPRYRYSCVGLRWASLASLAPMPPAEYAPLDDPSPIVRWMGAARSRGKSLCSGPFPVPRCGSASAPWIKASTYPAPWF